MSAIPSILSTDQYRHLVLDALNDVAVSLEPTAGKTFISPNGDVWILSVDDDGTVTTTKV